MKHLLTLVFSCALLLAAFACSDRGKASSLSMLGTAEDALALGNVGVAQQVADSIAAADDFGGLDVDGLCRLSLLLMRLAETNVDAGNTAMAARALEAAFMRDSDSTAVFIGNVPYDMRAAVVVAAALAGARNHPLDSDSLSLCGDSVH